VSARRTGAANQRLRHDRTRKMEGHREVSGRKIRIGGQTCRCQRLGRRRTRSRGGDGPDKRDLAVGEVDMEEGVGPTQEKKRPRGGAG
jgi:hypothetical protein